MQTRPYSIGIDVTVLAYNREGIGNYVLQLLLALSSLNHPSAKRYEFVLLADKSLPISFPELNESFPVITLKQRSGWASGLRTSLDLAVQAKKNKLDLLISTHSHLLPLFFQPSFWLIHDISPIVHPEYFNSSPHSGKQLVFKSLFRTAVRRSARILTISEFSRKEVLDNYHVSENRVATIGASWGNLVANTTALHNRQVNSEALGRYKLAPEKYFLSIGTLSPRKNIETMVKAFAALAEDTRFDDYKLVVAGKEGWLYEPIYKVLDALHSARPELRLKQRIIFTGYIDDHTAASLLAHCKALVSASHYEGFGLPPLEALNYDREIILSDIPVYREIYNNFAHFFPPTDVTALAAMMESVVAGSRKFPDSKSSELEELLHKYSWQQVAANLLNEITNYVETGEPTQ